MSFALYIIGYLILIAGLALGAFYLHVAAHWIAVGVLVLIGIGIATGVARTRQKDPA
jgi:predicted signal transduction protein with EAL and GGDEF domain